MRNIQFTVCAAHKYFITCAPVRWWMTAAHQNSHLNELQRFAWSMAPVWFREKLTIHDVGCVRAEYKFWNLGLSATSAKLLFIGFSGACLDFWRREQGMSSRAPRYKWGMFVYFLNWNQNWRRLNSETFILMGTMLCMCHLSHFTAVRVIFDIVAENKKKCDQTQY